MDNVRGKIRNRYFATQVKDFSGMQFGNITPTDSDLEIEYHNTAWVFGELKYKEAELPFGQRLALERKCDDMQKVKPTIGIIASHKANENEDIDVANAKVVAIRYKGKWNPIDGFITVRRVTEMFLNIVETRFSHK